MSDLKQAIRSVLRRPKVGATAVFFSVQTGGTHWHLAERILGNASWYLLAAVLLITLVPLPNKLALDTRGLLVVGVAYLLYTLALEVASRRLRSRYDRTWFRTLRLAVSIGMVSMLIVLSGGQYSYFWFFYTLPLFQSIIYFRKLSVFLSTIGIVVTYMLVSLLTTVAEGNQVDYTLLGVNAVILLMVGAVLYWLFGSLKASKRLDPAETEALQRTSQDLAAQLDRAELLRVIILRAIELVHGTGGGIYEYDPSHKRLQVIADQGGKRSISGQILSENEGMAGRVVQTREPLIVNDYDSWPDRTPYFERGLFHAVIAAPLIWEQHILGVLYVTDDSADRVFKDHDKYLLTLLAAQAAIAMLEETSRRANEIERQAKHLRLINQVADRLTSSPDVKPVMTSVVTDIAQAFNVRQCRIILRDKHTDYGQVWSEYQAERDTTAARLLIPFNNNPALEWLKQRQCPLSVLHAESDVRLTALRDGLQASGVKSMVLAPLLIQNELVGILELDALDAVREFTPEEVKLVQTLANQIATAISNTRLFEQAKQSASQWETLHRINERISSALTLENIFEATLREGMLAFNATAGSVMLVEPETQALEVKASLVQGVVETRASLKTMQINEGIAGYVAHTGIPYLCNDVLTDSHFDPAVTDRPFRSLLCVPIMAQGYVLGVISVASEVAHFFDDDSLKFFSALASQVAAAIESNRLRAVGIALSNLSLDTLLAAIVQHSSLLTGAEYSTMFLVDPDTGECNRARNYPPSRTTLDNPRRDGLTMHVIQTGQPLIINDAQHDARVKQASKDLGITGIIGVPMVVREEAEAAPSTRTIGALFANTIQQRHFAARDVELLQSLANQASIALENARLLTRIQQQLTTLGKLYKAASVFATVQEMDEMLTNIATLVGESVASDFTCVTLLSGDHRWRGAREYDVRPVSSHPANEGHDQFLEQGLLWKAVKAFQPTRAFAIHARDKGITSYLVEQDRAVVFDDVPTDGCITDDDLVEAGINTHNPALVNNGIKSYGGLPLKVKGKVLGALFVHSYRSYAFAQQLELLKALASQAAVAIENVTLLEETRQRAAVLETLHTISLDIASREPIPELLQSILARAVELSDAKGGGLYLLDSDGDPVRLAATSPDLAAQRGMIIRRSEGLIGSVIRSKQPQAVDDYRQYPQHLAQFAAYRFTAVAAVPILWQGNPLGAIAVHDDIEGRTFGKDDLSLLYHLANLAAVTLQNAYRLDESQRLMSSALDAIIVVDRKGRIVKLNQKASDLLGYRDNEMRMQPVAAFLANPYEIRKIASQLFHDKQGRFTGYETLAKGNRGDIIPIQLSASFLFDYEEKRPIGIVGHFHDLRKIEGARKHITQLTGLLAAGQVITQLRDLHATLEAIVDNTREGLKADPVILYRYDDETDTIHTPPIRRGLHFADSSGIDVGPDSIVRRVIAIGDVHFADEAQSDPVLSGTFVDREAIYSCAACPLKMDNRIVGVLFCNYRQPHPFSPEEQKLVELFANSAALAIANAQLFDQSQQDATRLRSTSQISAAMNSTLVLEEKLRLAIREMGKVFGSDYASIAMFDIPQEDYARIVAEFPERPAPESKPSQVPMKRSQLAQALRLTPSMIVIEDMALEMAVHTEMWEAGVLSRLLVPLSVNDKIGGIIQLDWRTKAHRFRDNELELARALANELVLAIDIAKAQEVAIATENIEFAFVLLAYRAHRIRQESFALQNDLTSLENDLPTGLYDDILTRMRHSIDEVHLSSARLHTDTIEMMEQASVDLPEMIAEVAEALCHHPARNIPIVLRTEGACTDCRVQAHSRLLKFAITMLIKNAVESMEKKGAPGTLLVRYQRFEGIILVGIADTGLGIPDILKQDLFHKRVRSEGMGLGAYAASIILKKHHGEIRLGDQPDGGALVEFWLPLSGGAAPTS